MKGLDKTVSPQSRETKYSKLIWHLNYSEDEYILGDFGILVEVESRKKYTTFWTKDFNLNKIYLPISKNHLLVGSNSSDEKFIESSELNILIAEHSREYFISSNNSPKLQNLSDLIGDKSQIFTEEEIMESCREIFKI